MCTSIWTRICGVKEAGGRAGRAGGQRLRGRMGGGGGGRVCVWRYKLPLAEKSAVEGGAAGSNNAKALMERKTKAVVIGWVVYEVGEAETRGEVVADRLIGKIGGG